MTETNPFYKSNKTNNKIKKDTLKFNKFNLIFIWKTQFVKKFLSEQTTIINNSFRVIFYLWNYYELTEKIYRNFRLATHN